MFITFEGIGCSGKTTQSKLLLANLKNMGLDVVLTREPQNNDVLKFHNNFSHSRAQLLVYIAQRYEHFVDVILPALQSDKIVICDRYIDSTTVYQGYLGKIKSRTIFKLHSLICEDIYFTEPDVTFLLDINLKIFAKRISDRVVIEDKDLLNHRNSRKIKLAYLDIAEKNRERIIKFDTSSATEIETSDLIFDAFKLLQGSSTIECRE